MEPSIRTGDQVTDLIRGRVTVTGFRKGFPLCEEPPRPGPNPSSDVPILCGHLVWLVATETISKVATMLEVSPRMVRRWRMAVAGVEKEAQVSTGLALKRADPKFRRTYMGSDTDK